MPRKIENLEATGLAIKKRYTIGAVGLILPVLIYSVKIRTHESLLSKIEIKVFQMKEQVFISHSGFI